MIYSTPSCTFCNMAKDYLKENNIPFEEYDVAADAQKRMEMLQKTGQMGVPVIDINGKIMIGFEKNTLAKKIAEAEAEESGNLKMAA